MPEPCDLPIPEGADPLDGGDPEQLRAEILRLRDAVLGEQARAAVLEDRVAELEDQVEELATANDRLQTELARSPLTRALRAIDRRVRGRA